MSGVRTIRIGDKEYNLKTISDDGNCLFSAVADQLYNNPSRQNDIRLIAHEYITNNSTEFPFVTNKGELETAALAAEVARNSDPEAANAENRYRKAKEARNLLTEAETLEEHLSGLLSGAWGSQYDIIAISKAVKKTIEIYENDGEVIRIRAGGNDITNADTPIRLLYTRSAKGGSLDHYESIREVDDEKYPLMREPVISSSEPPADSEPQRLLTVSKGNSPPAVPAVINSSPSAAPITDLSATIGSSMPSYDNTDVMAAAGLLLAGMMSSGIMDDRVSVSLITSPVSGSAAASGAVPPLNGRSRTFSDDEDDEEPSPLSSAFPSPPTHLPELPPSGTSQPPAGIPPPSGTSQPPAGIPPPAGTSQPPAGIPPPSEPSTQPLSVPPTKQSFFHRLTYSILHILQRKPETSGQGGPAPAGQGGPSAGTPAPAPTEGTPAPAGQGEPAGRPATGGPAGQEEPATGGPAAGQGEPVGQGGPAAGTPSAGKGGPEPAKVGILKKISALLWPIGNSSRPPAQPPAQPPSQPSGKVPAQPPTITPSKSKPTIADLPPPLASQQGLQKGSIFIVVKDSGKHYLMLLGNDNQEIFVPTGNIDPTRIEPTIASVLTNMMSEITPSSGFKLLTPTDSSYFTVVAAPFNAKPLDISVNPIASPLNEAGEWIEMVENLDRKLGNKIRALLKTLKIPINYPPPEWAKAKLADGTICDSTKHTIKAAIEYSQVYRAVDSPGFVAYADLFNRRENLMSMTDDNDSVAELAHVQAMMDSYYGDKKIFVRDASDSKVHLMAVPNPHAAASYREDSKTTFANPAGSTSTFDPSGSMFKKNMQLAKALIPKQLLVDKKMTIAILESLWYCGSRAIVSDDPRCFPIRFVNELRDAEENTKLMSIAQAVEGVWEWPFLKKIIRKVKAAVPTVQDFSFDPDLLPPKLAPAPLSSAPASSAPPSSAPASSASLLAPAGTTSPASPLAPAPPKKTVTFELPTPISSSPAAVRRGSLRYALPAPLGFKKH